MKRVWHSARLYEQPGGARKTRSTTIRCGQTKVEPAIPLAMALLVDYREGDLPCLLRFSLRRSKLQQCRHVAVAFTGADSAFDLKLTI